MSEYKLKVLGLSVSTSQKRWVCQCVCGDIRTYWNATVIYNGTRSCGCLRKDKGTKLREATQKKQEAKSKSFKEKVEQNKLLKQRRSYRVWMAIKCRCSQSPSNSRYEDYTGRGIAVCDSWQNSYDVFLKDMGEPEEWMEIDRIENGLGYYKENCRWVTRKENGRNKRNNYLLTLNGETKTAIEWCETLGIGYSTIKRRRKRGLSDEEILSTTKFNRHQKKDNYLLTLNGESKTALEWSKVLGISYQVINAKRRRGLSHEEILSKDSVNKK